MMMMMMMSSIILKFILIICILISLVNGFQSIEGLITVNSILTSISSLGPTTRITLNHGQYSTYLKEDGSFTLQNIPPGTYTLNIENMYYTFERIRIDISKESIQATSSNLGTDWKQMGSSIAYPLLLEAKSKIEYFEKRDGFNVWKFISNPMILMSGGSLLTIFILPKLMGSIDPDLMKEIQSQPQPQMPQLPDISSSLANMMTGGGTSNTAALSTNKRRES